MGLSNNILKGISKRKKVLSLGLIVATLLVSYPSVLAIQSLISRAKTTTPVPETQYAQKSSSNYSESILCFFLDVDQKRVLPNSEITASFECATKLASDSFGKLYLMARKRGTTTAFRINTDPQSGFCTGENYCSESFSFRLQDYQNFTEPAVFDIWLAARTPGPDGQLMSEDDGRCTDIPEGLTGVGRCGVGNVPLELRQGTLCPLTSDNSHFRWREIFNPTFNKLNNHYWYPNGDWGGDWMHDATSFAPTALYLTGRDCQNENFVNRANVTIELELGYVDAVVDELSKENPDEEALKRKAYPAIMGHLALLEGYKNYSGDPENQLKVRRYAKGGTLLTSALIIASQDDPGYEAILQSLIPTGFNEVTVYAQMAEANFKLAKLTHSPFWADLGITIVELAEDNFLVRDAVGTYYTANPSQPLLSVPNQSFMLSALAEAYAYSRDQKYVQLANDVESTLLDPDKGLYDLVDGGFFRTRLGYVKYLSQNIEALWGLIKWQTLFPTNQRESIVVQTVDFLKRRLYYDNLFHHDWNAGTQQRSYGYCTGCNFFVLDILYDFELGQTLIYPGGIRPTAVVSSIDPSKISKRITDNVSKSTTVRGILNNPRTILGTPEKQIDELLTIILR